MRKIIKKLNSPEIIFFTILALLPLAFDYWAFDMFEVTKNIIFKIGLSLILIIFLWKNVEKKNISFISSKLINITTLLLLATLLLSLITSFNPTSSFFGSYFRQQGVINYLYYILLFFIALNFFKKKENRSLFLKITTAVGIIVSLYAIVQKIGIDIFPEIQTAIFAGRSFATIGNPTMLGAYLIFPYWTNIALFTGEKKKKNKIFHIIAFLIIVLAIIFTANRATMLAILITSFASLLYKFKKYKKTVISIVVLGIILFVSFVGLYAKDLRSIKSRVSVWKSSIEIIEENPIFGTGAESFSLQFEKHVRPDFFENEDYFKLVDRPHSEPLEMWIHFGILGIIIYLILLFSVLKKALSKSTIQEKIIATGILTLFITNLFSFSLVIHYFFLAISLGFIFSSTAKPLKFKNNIASKILSIIFFIILILSIVLNALTFASNHKLKTAYNDLNTSNFEKSLNNTALTIKLSPFYHELYAKAFDISFSIAKYTNSNETLQQAIKYNQKENKLSGENMKSLLNTAKIFTYAGDYSSAEETYTTISKNFSPHPIIYEYWANFYFDQKNYEMAAKVYDVLFEIMPDHWKAPVFSDEKLDENQRIFWKNHPDFIETLGKAIITYEKIGEIEKSEEIKKILE